MTILKVREIDALAVWPGLRYSEAPVWHAGASEYLSPGHTPASWKLAASTANQPPRITEPLMPLPVRHLTVLQNWDCHVCGTCCKEYPVAVTDEERRRIEEQHWDKESGFQGIPLFKTVSGLLVHRQELNRRAD